MDPRKKLELNQRIVDSAHQYRRKGFLRNTLMAASIIVLLTAVSLIWWIQNDVDDTGLSIMRHAASVEADMDSESNVKLVLSNDREVKINENSVNIAYSANGQNVQINNSENIKQQDSGNKEPMYNTILVPYGKRSQIVLSDGSKVWLNAGTKFTYPAKFSEKRREVFLLGEAIFEVTHDADNPFYVVTEDYQVKVLGTVFNVSSYADDGFTSTALESGRVEIDFPRTPGLESQVVKMLPGTLTTYRKSEKQLKLIKTDIEQYMSWRKGSFIFNNCELRNIVKKIARHYNMQITIENEKLEQRKFSGSLDITEDIEHTLNILKETASFNYHKENNQILINQTN